MIKYLLTVGLCALQCSKKYLQRFATSFEKEMIVKIYIIEIIF